MWEVTIPDTFPRDKPFTINMNGTTYTFYDMSKIESGLDITSTYSLFDIKGLSDDEIKNKIYNIVDSGTGDNRIKRDGDTITVSGKHVNESIAVTSYERTGYIATS